MLLDKQTSNYAVWCTILSNLNTIIVGTTKRKRGSLSVVKLKDLTASSALVNTLNSFSERTHDLLTCSAFELAIDLNIWKRLQNEGCISWKLKILVCFWVTTLDHQNMAKDFRFWSHDQWRDITPRFRNICIRVADDKSDDGRIANFAVIKTQM